MGVGMTVVVSPQDADSVLRDGGIAGYEPVVIGDIVAGAGAVRMEF